MHRKLATNSCTTIIGHNNARCVNLFFKDWTQSRRIDRRNMLGANTATALNKGKHNLFAKTASHAMELAAMLVLFLVT